MDKARKFRRMGTQKESKKWPAFRQQDQWYSIRVHNVKVKVLVKYMTSVSQGWYMGLKYRRLRGDQKPLIEFRGLFWEGLKHPKKNSKGAAEWELGREYRGGKMLFSTVKFFDRILFMEKYKMLKCCHEWQLWNLKRGNWAIVLRHNCTKLMWGTSGWAGRGRI
jgi:hypothetical protein